MQNIVFHYTGVVFYILFLLIVIYFLIKFLYKKSILFRGLFDFLRIPYDLYLVSNMTIDQLTILPDWTKNIKSITLPLILFFAKNVLTRKKKKN